MEYIDAGFEAALKIDNCQNHIVLGIAVTASHLMTRCWAAGG
jgi:hypothetical protein